MAIINNLSLGAFTWQFTLLATGAIISVYCLSIVIYRVAFHPLAKYPGPLLAKITDWRDVYVASTGDKHLDFHALHEKYGPIVRYGPNKLSFNHPSALKSIYGHKSNVRKSDFYLSFPIAPGVFSTHTAIDRNAHARKRRVMSHAFSENALKSVEGFVIEHIQTWMQKLAAGKPDQWTEPRDVHKWNTYFIFDVMGDLAFGKSFDLLEGNNQENIRATHLLGQAAKRHNIMGTMPWLHQSGFDKLLFRQINKDRDDYMKFSKSMVGRRMNSDIHSSTRKDFFYYLLNAKDPESGQGFAKGELWGESNTLIIAGSDTTSTTFSSTIFYLLHNPEALERIEKEVRSTFGSVEDIRSGPTLNSCTYVRACIDEAMRMSPPVGGVLPRRTLEGGLEVLGERIPAGVDVGCPIYALQHNKDFIAEPFTYKPERWLSFGGNSQTSLKDLHDCFTPFSIGPRGCIGKPMAYLELTIGIARLVWQYDMRLTPGLQGRIGEGKPELGKGRERPGEFQLTDIFVSKMEGPFANFRPRQR